MTLAKARQIQLAHVRSVRTLRLIAQTLLMSSDEADRKRAAEFLTKAKRVERATLDEPIAAEPR